MATTKLMVGIIKSRGDYIQKLVDAVGSRPFTMAELRRLDLAHPEGCSLLKLHIHGCIERVSRDRGNASTWRLTGALLEHYKTGLTI